MNGGLPNKKNWTILVVDDEEEMRSLIADFLSDDEGYTVLTAQHGRDALDNVLGKHKVDLVLSDINMPVMRGFELLNEVRRLYPEIKRVLITAYNVEDYIEMASKYDIGNIFVKTTPFNFEELTTVLHSLLTEDVFGIERYFDAACPTQRISVKRGDMIDENVRKIVGFLPPAVVQRKLNLVLVEILTNAIFYGIRKEDPDKKELWNYDFELSDKEAIEVTAAHDDKKYAISIADNGGRLEKKEVLYWLHRQVARDASGMPLGLNDTHGRGFFIARRYIDRLIINIARGRKTEIVIINYTGEVYQGSKPLYINEL